MRTRSQSRNLHHQQQQAPPAFVEPFNLEEPIENPAPPLVPMDDTRTMAQLLQAPTDKYGYIKNHKKTVKNGQARTRESEEYKSRKQSQESQASVKSSQSMVNKSQQSPSSFYNIHKG
ncbi:hypothetical protein Tco_0904483 [Tanacetum coccineum]